MTNKKAALALWDEHGETMMIFQFGELRDVVRAALEAPDLVEVARCARTLVGLIEWVENMEKMVRAGRVNYDDIFRLYRQFLNDNATAIAWAKEQKQ